MPTYFQRLRTGMRQAQALLTELMPEAKVEWGPMDNAGNFALYVLSDGRKELVYRFSKDSLVSMDDDAHRSKVRELLRQAVGHRLVR
jgi:hypothetical protein